MSRWTRKLYLDLDGVFADFDTRVKELLGNWPWLLDDGHMWSELDKVSHFYLDLPLMPRAKPMWEALKIYEPTFLSGVPLPNGEMVTAPADKRAWVDRHFGTHVQLITCPSKEKATFCKPGDLLLDDRIGYAPLWTAAGGIFIRYFPIDTDKLIQRVHGYMASPNDTVVGQSRE